MKELEVVAGILFHNGKVLCMQRNKSQFEYVSYKFEFPGGKVEGTEHPVDALRRELLEELELHVEVLEETPYMTVHHAYPDFLIHMHAFRCNVHALRYKLHDHIDAVLLPVSDLLLLDWAPADLPIVHKLMGSDPMNGCS